MKPIITFGLGVLTGVLIIQYRTRKLLDNSAPVLPPPPGNNGGFETVPVVPVVVPSFPALPPPTKPVDSWVATTTNNNSNGDYWEGAQVNGVRYRGFAYQKRGSSIPFGSFLPPNA